MVVFKFMGVLALGLCASASLLAADANCEIVKAASDKAQSQATYHTLSARKKEGEDGFQPSIITVKLGATTYSKVLGTPVPMQTVNNSSAEMREQMTQMSQALLEGPCQSVGSSTVAGKKVNGYTFEQSMMGSKSKSTMWINAATGLPMRQDTISEVTGALKFLDKLLPKSAEAPSGPSLSRTVLLFGEKGKPPAEDGTIEPAILNKLQALMN